MALAIRQLREYKIIPADPLTDSVAATSVGIVKGEAMLDLCYEEDSAAEVDMNVVLTGTGKYVEVQSTAERTPFDDDQLRRLLELARGGARELTVLQKAALDAVA
jgi:ribonuclease PH